MATKAALGRRVVVGAAGVALCASSLATGLTTPAFAAPAPAVDLTTADAPADPSPEISRLIVAYEPGVSPVTPGGAATGSGAGCGPQKSGEVTGRKVT